MSETKNQKKPKEYYVNKKELYDAIVEYKKQENPKPNSKLSNYIGLAIKNICTGLSNSPNFIGYTYRDDMVSDGMENCISAIRSFDPEKSDNPFGYFTQIAWYAFLRRIAKEKKQNYIKHKNMQNMDLSGLYEEMTYGDSGGKIQQGSDEISNEIIDSFEKKLTSSKKPATMIGIEKLIETEIIDEKDLD